MTLSTAGSAPGDAGGAENGEAANVSHRLSDRLEIRDLIESWVVWRDMGDWDRLREIWLPDGTMSASWREGTADEFIAANRAGWDKGLDILHQLGGSVVTISGCGTRAISITKMVISQRAQVDGVWCDVSAQSRHFDRWEKRQGRWGLLQRKTIFDRDRLDAVATGTTVPLDQTRLAALPASYRHLGYLQSSLGYPVRSDIPHLRSETEATLLRQGRAWLQENSASATADTPPAGP